MQKKLQRSVDQHHLKQKRSGGKVVMQVAMIQKVCQAMTQLHFGGASMMLVVNKSLPR